ncbi:MAG TPA: phosphoribosylglycinamide formyltransferase [Candidatus Competibacteraceae bacterium]|nr:phosphoribosylglycinamide formyltransferase [Candidatus Competibacteraceae bacterium]
MSAARRPRVVVLISGRGSNLQAIIDGVRDGSLPVELAAVISNRPGAAGLERARAAGIPAFTLDHKNFLDRASFDAALRELIDAQRPDYVLLAGFMRILSDAFVEHYRGRMLNIHPSLLPAYRGVDTHARALAAGERWHGASVHFVTPELDGGPVILQARVPVLPGDDADTLAARVLEQEHRIYPLALRWLARGRVRLEGDTVLLDGQPLSRPLLLEELQ